MPQPWFKLFREKLMGSPRVRALKPHDYAVYMHLMVACDETGAMKSGRRVWTIEDIALECNAPNSRVRIRKAIDTLKENGLVYVRPADGAFVVANFCDLQRATRRPRRERKGSGPGPRRIEFG